MLVAYKQNNKYWYFPVIRVNLVKYYILKSKTVNSKYIHIYKKE